MQKSLLVLLLVLPTLSFANTVHLASANITSQDSIRGYSFAYTAVFERQYMLSFGYADASKDDRSISAVSADISYGFQSFETGSTYVSLGVADIDNSTVTISTSIGDIALDSSGGSGFARVGYAKLSGEGLDYDLSLFSMDGETSVGASIRGALDDSDWGWQLGIASDGDEAAFSAGFSLMF